MHILQLTHSRLTDHVVSASPRSAIDPVLHNCRQSRRDQHSAVLSNRAFTNKNNNNNFNGRPTTTTIIESPPPPANERSSSGGSTFWSLPAHLEAYQQRNDMFNAKTGNRRERTFVGSICAACDEPLEHILRGERILQLACGHVSHEACFYGYIREFELDTCPSCDKPLGFDTRKASEVDFDNLNQLLRSAQKHEWRDNDEDDDDDDDDDPHHHHQTGMPELWDDNASRSCSQRSSQLKTSLKPSRDRLLPDRDESVDRRSERHHAFHESHTRKSSRDTGVISNNGSSNSHQQHDSRPHDYDAASMVASVTNPHLQDTTMIPAPLVTVRSEFPTLTKSRHQQSLTCLVTVEVVGRKWQASSIADSPRPPPPSSLAEERLESSPPRLRPVSQRSRPVDSVHEDTSLQRIRDDLVRRVDNWHGLEYDRFGELLLHGVMSVGKDRQAWQELECYLFSEMLVCVKRKKKTSSMQTWDSSEAQSSALSRCTLKGSILIKKHLSHMETFREGHVLTLHLTVPELPAFHMQCCNSEQLDLWQRTIVNLSSPPESKLPAYGEFDHRNSSEEDDTHSKRTKRLSSIPSSYGKQSHETAPTEYTNSRCGAPDWSRCSPSLHVPVDLVVVVPVTPSMQGLKINVLRDALRFMVSNLGPRDRMGLVTFGLGSGPAALVGMTTKGWSGWPTAINSIRPVGVKNFRADVVDGANVAIDLLMQRRAQSQLSHVMLISDSSTSDPDSVDFVVSRAEAAKISIHSFGLGLTHKPDTMVAMSTKTKASYTYVKDWLMLREALAGCLGSLQSISHQSVKVKLRIPEGSPAKFIKLSGALHATKRSTGREAEASLGDLRFGDKRDILVQLAIQPDVSSPDSIPTDPWENMISGLEALGPIEPEAVSRAVSLEELPLIQADLTWRDIKCEGRMSQLPRPSLLAIPMLPAPSKKHALRSFTPPIPPHPSVVQRRMELLTSDMLSRALGLVARGQNDRAQHLLSETRSILKGLGKGVLPPLPTPPPSSALPPPITPRQIDSARNSANELGSPHPPRSPNPSESPVPFGPSGGGGIDRAIMTALDSELEASLEWICHPTVFGRDTRKSILQAIGVISSQRGFTFRTPSESLWAQRVPGVKGLVDCSLKWREVGEDEALLEVSEANTSNVSLCDHR